MTFIFSCLFYSFIGCLTGFFAHIFSGLIQKDLALSIKSFIKTVRNFCKILAIMTLSTLGTAICILVIPSAFLQFIGSDIEFFYQLVFYLLAFGAFDFGLKN